MGTLKTIPLDLIDLPATELRVAVEDDRVHALADSIARVGLLQPIGVVPDGRRYRLTFGVGRYLAHTFLGKTSIDCLVGAQDDGAAIEAASAENIVRRDLSPVEEARALRALMDAHGRTLRDVAHAVGKSESWVRGRLELLLYPEEIVGHVARRELSVSVARELVLVEEETTRAIYTRAAVENGVTAAQARLWREEWEARRAYQSGEEAPTGAPPPQPGQPVPSLICHVCDGVFPVTAISLVRTCPGCVAELSAAKKGR